VNAIAVCDRCNVHLVHGLYILPYARHNCGNGFSRHLYWNLFFKFGQQRRTLHTKTYKLFVKQTPYGSNIPRSDEQLGGAAEPHWAPFLCEPSGFRGSWRIWTCTLHVWSYPTTSWNTVGNSGTVAPCASFLTWLPFCLLTRTWTVAAARSHYSLSCALYSGATLSAQQLWRTDGRTADS